MKFKLYSLFKTIGLISILFVLLAMPSVSALAAAHVQEADPQVGESQLYLIGLISTVVIYILNQLAARKVQVHRGPLTVGLFALSWGLAAAWGGIVLPVFAAFSDPVTFFSAVFGYLNDLLIAIGPSFAFATLIYNVFMKRLLDAGFDKLTSVNLSEPK